MTGYFGKDRPEELVGLVVGREVMLKESIADCDRVVETLKEDLGRRFVDAFGGPPRGGGPPPEA